MSRNQNCTPRLREPAKVSRRAGHVGTRVGALMLCICATASVFPFCACSKVCVHTGMRHVGTCVFVGAMCVLRYMCMNACFLSVYCWCIFTTV